MEAEAAEAAEATAAAVPAVPLAYAAALPLSQGVILPNIPVVAPLYYIAQLPATPVAGAASTGPQEENSEAAPPRARKRRKDAIGLAPATPSQGAAASSTPATVPAAPQFADVQVEHPRDLPRMGSFGKFVRYYAHAQGMTRPALCFHALDSSGERAKARLGFEPLAS